MRIGILGGGQLGRMLALAGYPLGMTFRFYDNAPDACARQVGELVCGEWDDETKLREFCKGLDVVTYEFENVPLSTARIVSSIVPVRPGIEALEVAQHRIREKQMFVQAGLLVQRFAQVNSAEQAKAACELIGVPCVVKAAQGGYDGKGQCVVRTRDDVENVWETLGKRELIVEEFVSFEKEVSLIAVRGLRGEYHAYPLTQNRHESGILRESVAPAPDIGVSLQRIAEQQVRQLMTVMNYVGVLAVEFFVERTSSGETRLIANEMAPRVHNSGHWTMNGAITSQYENHLRAICVLPIGGCANVPGTTSAMINFIGAIPNVQEVLSIPGAALHAYGKEPRAGRKVGHVNLLSEVDDVDAKDRVRQLCELAAACSRSARA